MTMMTLNDCITYLNEHDGYLLVTHIHPDGDTLGSAAALCHMLRRMGKTAFVYNNPETTERYSRWTAPYIAPVGFTPDCVVTIDLAAENLFPKSFRGGAVNLCIDHHPTNTGYAENLLCQPNKASCGEIILQLANEMLGGPDKDEADLLYMAVSTDCGCFVYANTTAETHRAAAQLIEAGADHKQLNIQLFRATSFARLTLEGMIFAGLRRFGPDKSVTVATVTLDMMESSGATEDDCDDLASLAGRVAGSRVSVTIREMKPCHCKISLRSGPMFDSSAICALHGGGGHRMASGCTIDAGPEEARDILVREILEAL
ncbi:MAG: bifunctional oligoribonuclease/PAP phosphatase NrnA [Oscillospiraceae bacterium]|nr:bifunctional oligoribonuclease/PAP phosphatase NrnA [Oscillospiraceae bacterium]